jgi:hypothetical protein
MGRGRLWVATGIIGDGGGGGGCCLGTKTVRKWISGGSVKIMYMSRPT